MGDFEFLYLCDQKACENCNGECRHTSDIEHAVNRDCFDGCMFQFFEFFEGEDKTSYLVEVEGRRIDIRD